MGSPIVHFEIMGPEHEALRDFYASTLDWKHNAEQSLDNYHMMNPAEGSLAGGIGEGNEQMPTYLTIYAQVEDIEDTLAKIEANGGTTLVPRTEVPDIVTFALFHDPAGNMVGLVEPDEGAGS